MECYDLDTRRLICQERLARLARDGQGARDGSRSAHGRRELLRRLLGAVIRRRSGLPQPVR
jgi:hypothetical protein